MAKKLNKNLVVALTAIGFTLTTVVGILMVRQLKATDPQEFVKRAEEAKARKDWPRAATMYQQAYRTAPDRPEYLVLVGDMIYEQGDEEAALKAYRGAVQVDPSLIDAQEQILRIQLEYAKLWERSTQSWREVKDTAEAILKLKEDHPRAIYAKGVALLGLKELDASNEAEGVAFLERAVEAAPADVDASSALASYYGAAKRKEDAGRILRNVVEKNSAPGDDAATARCLLADYLRRQNDADGAIKTFEEALAVAGDSGEVRAKVLVNIGQFWFTRWRDAKIAQAEARTADVPAEEEMANYYAQAEAALRKALEAAPQEFDGYLLLGELLRLNAQDDAAIEVYKQRLALPFQRQGIKGLLVKWNRYRLLLGLANLYTSLAAGKARGTEEQDKLAEQADMYVEDAFGEISTGSDAFLARARIQFVLGKYREAVKSLEQAEQRGSRVVNWQVEHLLAQSLLELGTVGRAREAILKAVSVPNAPIACWVTLAKIQLQMQQPSEAIAVVNQILAKNPTNRDALLIKAAAQEQLGQSEVAGATLGAIADSAPVFISAQAQLLANQTRYDEAIAKLTPALEANPADPVLVRTAAVIYRAAKRNDDAKRLVEAALERAPDDFDLQILSLQLSDLPAEERQAKYQQMVDRIEDQYIRAVRLAGLYESEGDSAKQIAELEKAMDLIVNRSTQAAREAGETRLRSLVDFLFQLYTDTRNIASLDALVDKAASLNLDAADGLSYRGRRLMIDGYLAGEKAAAAAEAGRADEAEKERAAARQAYDKAIESLKAALEQYPSSGRTYAQLGEAYLQTERGDEARAAFERANEILPDNGVVLKRLALLAARRGNEAEFRRYLNDCQRLMPTDPWVAEQMLVLAEDENPQDVIARREASRTENPKDVGNLVRLVELYRKRGDTTKARERLDEVLALRSDAPTVEMAARLFREMDMPDRALQVLQKNLREAPAEHKAEAQLLIGDHYFALNPGAAEAAYLAAADINPNLKVCLAIGRYYLAARRFAETRTWLDKALERVGPGDAVEASAVRRLQIETAFRADEMDEAQRLCTAYVKENPDDPVGLFLESQLAYGQGRTIDAIDKLTKFLEKRPGFPLAVFRRAEYLGSTGKWQQAISDLENLRAVNPTALDYAPRALLAKAYAQVGRSDLAIQDLEGIFKTDPSASPVVQELIDLYMKNNRLADADRVVTILLSKEPDNAGWLLRSADIAVAQKDRSKALASFKRAAKLAGYAPFVTTRLLEACRLSKLNAVEQGITFLEDTVPAEKRSPPVLLAYANLLAERGDSTAAIDNYRLAVHRAGFGASDFIEQVAIAVIQTYQPAKAVELFKQAPNDAMFQRASEHVLSEILRLTGRLDEALPICDSLAASTTDQAEEATIQLRSAQIYHDIGQIEKAQKAYEQTLTFNKDNIVALNNLAYLLCDKLDRPQEAIPYARRAAQLSGAPAVLDTLGWAYLKTGQNREAIAQFAKARQDDPTFPPATYHLGEAMRRVGEFDNAIQLFNEVLKAPQGGPYDEYRGQAEEALQKAQSGSRD